MHRCLHGWKPNRFRSVWRVRVKFGFLLVAAFAIIPARAQDVASNSASTQSTPASPLPNQGISLERDSHPIHEDDIGSRHEDLEEAFDAPGVITGSMKPHPESPASSSPAIARSRPSESRTTWYQEPLVSLGLVVGVLIVLTWGARRWLPSRGLGCRGAQGSALRIISRLSVGPKQSVVLVELENSLLLLGVTPERITRLSEFDDPKHVAQLKSNVSNRAVPPGRSDFERTLGGEERNLARSRAKRIELGRLAPADSNQTQPVRELINALRQRRERQPRQQASTEQAERTLSAV